MSKAKFPKTIFVKWTELGSDEEPFLEAAQDADSFAEIGSAAAIGEYQLVRTAKVETEVTVK